MTIDVPVMELQRGLAVSSTIANFTAAAQNPIGTKPTASATRAVFDRGRGRQERNSLVLYPFGNNDNNDQIKLKVMGWSRVIPEPQNNFQEWIGVMVAELLCTLSNAIPGVALRPVVATDLFADTISLTSGLAVLFQGTADIDLAWAMVPVDGYEIVEVLPVLGANGDGANFLYAFK